MCVSVGDKKDEEQIRIVKPLIPGEEKTDGSGEYEIVDFNKAGKTGGDYKAPPVVARRGDVTAAREAAIALAREDPSYGYMASHGFSFRWKVINDGTQPGNVQVYDLLIGASYTGFQVRGPHIGKEEE